MHMREIQPSPKPLKDKLFSRIEEEHVCPHSRLFFKGRELFFWSFWLISVVVGALAVAVALFVVLSGQYAFYQATHENFFTFMVEALPYLWILTFIVMSYGAVYQIRHTKRGYRHSLFVVLVSSMLLSVAGGSALQLFGFGHEIDEVLGRHLSLYTSQKKFVERLWQDPAAGRLVGAQVYTTLAPTSTIILEDVAGQRWTIQVNELSLADTEMLASGAVVRILGKPIDEVLHLFHSCGVFPWAEERQRTRAEMSEERERYVEKVGVHARQAMENKPRLVGSSIASTTLTVESICATIKPVRRFVVPQEEEL